MSRLNMIPKLSLHNFYKCEYCSQAKIIKTSHKVVTKIVEPLEVIHFDLCEFDDMTTRNNKRYFITFIDDYFEFTFIYLFKNKSDVFDMFKVF